ncbi:MAG: hypothetical protein V7L20_01720 [Nostoc sp.]|uniref:hypothetical protein n=1 Tax=Nostoc sp. TaxID=1180 RepID=UPI002FFD0B29
MGSTQTKMAMAIAITPVNFTNSRHFTSRRIQFPPEEALKALVKEAITYEVAYPHRGMLWFQEVNQNQRKYFK